MNIRETPIGKLVRYPIQRVHVELTNVCNFDCVFCPKSVMTRPTGFMEKKLAFRIIDEIVDQRIADKVTFHVMGEPMMHPGFFEILDYCHKRGMNAGITTNGSLLSEKNAERLAQANVFQTNISLQTPDEDSFELRKAAGSLGYEQYADKVAGYVKKLRENNCKTKVKIHLLNTKFGGSIRKKLGGVAINATTDDLRATLTEWVEKIYSIPGIGESRCRERVLAGINKVTVNRWNVLEIAPHIFLETYLLDSWGNAFAGQHVVKAALGYCTTMRDHFGILYNGDLILCCKDYDGKTTIGNVREKSIVDLLNDEMVLKVVKGFRMYHAMHPYCKRCLGGEKHSTAILKQVGTIFFMRLMKWYFYNERRLYV